MGSVWRLLDQLDNWIGNSTPFGSSVSQRLKKILSRKHLVLGDGSRS